MKKYLLLILSLVALDSSLSAQQKGNKGKNSKGDYPATDPSNGIFGRNDAPAVQGKYSKNIPTRVGESFYRDYPHARDVYWTKYRGDWTVHFNSTGLFGKIFSNNAVATYHANGQRRDTRVNIPLGNVPAPVIGPVRRQFPGFEIGDVIRINIPEMDDIFRFQLQNQLQQRTVYYDANGKLLMK